MKTSTEIGSTAEVVGEERAVEMVAKAGFDAWDFSMMRMLQMDWANNRVIQHDHPFLTKDYLKFARQLKQVGLDNGIVCNQAHAPFPPTHPVIRDVLKRSIECAAEAGAEIIVVHPLHTKSVEENAEYYGDLLAFAKGCGIKIATENMWLWDDELDQAKFASCATPESFCAHIDALNDDDMVACLDVGHAEMRGSGTSAVELIHALGHRLQALHIHDNDKWKDLHQIPFSLAIDFPPIVKALKEIGYPGYFTLEVDYYWPGFTADEAQTRMNDLYGSVQKLVEMYNNA